MTTMSRICSVSSGWRKSINSSLLSLPLLSLSAFSQRLRSRLIMSAYASVLEPFSSGSEKKRLWLTLLHPLPQALASRKLLSPVHIHHCLPLSAKFFSITQRPCAGPYNTCDGSNLVCKVSFSKVNRECILEHTIH